METIQQTNGLADLADVPKKKPEPVVLRSPHDYALVEQSLTHRVEELKKLSKKNVEEGYRAWRSRAPTAAVCLSIVHAKANSDSIPITCSGVVTRCVTE